MVPPSPGPRWLPLVRWLVLVVGFVGLVLVTREAMGGDRARPSVAAGAGSLVLYAGAGVAAARGWSDLLIDFAEPRDARGAMYASQLTKYVPGGGVVQAAGQVTLSTTTRLPVSVAGLAWAVSIVLTVGGGAALLSTLALSAQLPIWARVVAPIGLLGLMAGDRDRLAGLLRFLRRWVTRIPPPDSLPSHRALRRAFAWTTAGIALNAASFSVLILDLGAEVSVLDVAPAFVAGWLAGFLLVPLPAGLGAREAVVVALVPGVGTGLLLAASVAQRIIAAAAEVSLLIGHRLSRRWDRSHRGRRAGSTPHR